MDFDRMGSRHDLEYAGQNDTFRTLPDIYAAAGLSEVLGPASGWVNGVKFSNVLAWKSTAFSANPSGLNDGLYLDDPHFFANDFGGAGDTASQAEKLANPGLNRFWVADGNKTDQFIIGNNAGTDLSNNWVYVSDYFGFWDKSDRYRVWFLMKKINDAADTGDPICTFYARNKDDDSLWCETVYDSMLTEDEWTWHMFNIDETLGGNAKRFAMRWRGSDDLGELYVAKIAFESDRHYKLYEGNSQLSGDYWNCLYRELFGTNAFHSINGTPFLGMMCWEPWYYGWDTYKDVCDTICSRYNSFERVALYPGHPGSMMDNYIEATEVNAMWYDNHPIRWHMDGPGGNDDWWHWEGSEDDGDVILNYISIQDAWEYMIDGTDSNTGKRGAAEAANRRGVPLYLNIQASGEILKDDNDNYYLDGEGEPTPRMILCQGYLDMTFAAKGFFYSYYGPIYGYGIASDYHYKPPIMNSDRFNCFNGAAVSGLVSYCPDTSNTEDTLIGRGDDPTVGSSRDANDNFTGWLRPNPKWYAALEFNQYVREVEGFYSGLHYNNSKCPEDEDIDNGVIDFITIEATYILNPNRVDDDENWVQVGIFTNRYSPNRDLPDREVRDFMLVNRRCDEDGGRWIECTVDFQNNNKNHVIIDVESGIEQSIGLGDLTFSYWLDPGVGRLFRGMSDDNFRRGSIDVDERFSGVVIIDSLLTVGSAATLTIDPGTDIIFTEYGQLVVNGALFAAGNDYSDTSSTIPDSTINFFCLTDDKDGIIELKGSSVDTLIHCNFSNLNTGLKVNRGSNGSTYIEQSEFNFNLNEGISASGGSKISISNSTFTGNGSDGAYVYNCEADIDSSSFKENIKNGLYLYSVNANSELIKNTFLMNGGNGYSSTDANVRFINCSPKMEKCEVFSGSKYGAYGANGSYPVLYKTGSTAANTFGNNAEHETYWDASYPSMSYGHNNFDVEDDTLIYITNSSISAFYAYGNYWGGGAPNTGLPSSSYYGPGTFYYSNYDLDKQTRVHGDEGQFDPSFTKGGDDFLIADNEEDALNLFIETFDLEKEEPFNAIDAYRDLIAEFPETSISTMCVDRIMWLIRNNYSENARQRELAGLLVYFNRLSRCEENADLAWKARRARLWTFAAMHRYDEGIDGFEEIVRNPDSFADSVYAVIDIGTLHLEAEEWERRNEDGERGDAVIGFGSMPELCPADFPEHRVHTDELLALLGSVDSRTGRPTIPTEYFLAQNYPNPFNSMTKIQYGLPEATHVKIGIYDIMGREVITLIDTEMKAGYYTNVWQGRNTDDVPISSGMYFYQIQAGNYLKTRKMILVK